MNWQDFLPYAFEASMAKQILFVGDLVIYQKRPALVVDVDITNGTLELFAFSPHGGVRAVGVKPQECPEYTRDSRNGLEYEDAPEAPVSNAKPDDAAIAAAKAVLEAAGVK